MTIGKVERLQPTVPVTFRLPGYPDLAALLTSIGTRRQSIPFAADALYPYHNPDNRETRARFGLPRTSPYSPKMG